MALEICTEAFVRLFFVTIKVLFENWGWALTFLALGLFLSRIPFVLGLVGDVFNFIADTFTSLLAGTIIGSLFTGALAAAGLGIFWTALVIGSRANIALRIAAAPFAFLAGAVYGLIPIPIPTPITMALDWGLKQKESTANIICFIPAVLLVLAALFLQAFVGESLCSFVSTALSYFV